VILSYLVCSQIWLNHFLDDRHFAYITKSLKETLFGGGGGERGLLARLAAGGRAGGGGGGGVRDVRPSSERGTNGELILLRF
jgi:hypothetical protein